MDSIINPKRVMRIITYDDVSSTSQDIPEQFSEL